MTVKTKLSEAESAVAAEIGEAFRLLTDALQMFELDNRCNDPDDDAYVWRHHTSDLLQRIQTKNSQKS